MKLILFTVGAAMLGLAQPITVRFGEPNVWSLDQAHYLLEQRFQKNHTLEVTRPTNEELNANAVHGSKLTAIRSLLQAGATLDTNVALNNQLVQRRFAEDLSLRQTRLDSLTQSFAEQARIGTAIESIAGDPSNYAVKPDGTRGDMLAEPKAKTSALTLALDVEKRRGEHIKSSLTDSVPTQLKQAEPPTLPTLGLAGFDMLKDKFAFGDPKLAASNVIDNFVNLQNEMIMKQVTLLRNEAGVNRSIVFAELPQSIEVEGLRWYRKKAENKLVQVQWEVRGFLFKNRLRAEEITKEYEKEAAKYEGRQVFYKSPKPLAADASDEENGMPYVRRDVIEKTIELMCAPSAKTLLYKGAGAKSPSAANKYLENLSYGFLDETCPNDDGKAKREQMPPGTVRAVELVPRQSSLNINDRHYAHNAINLFGLFRLLSGFGLNVGYQRQKETYEQYINQEVYASSYGKGEREFGWAFAPNPGTRTVAPGQRTTYAIFSVPANALSAVLRARACVYDRRDRLKLKEDCPVEWQEFVIPLPSENDSSFWVNEIRYAPALSGTRQMVYLKGSHFSNLTGVVVNGVPLRRSVALANPELSTPTSVQNGDGGIVGEYELLGSNQLVMAFKMPTGYAGTPMISLITPRKARYLNDLTLRQVKVGAKRYFGGSASLSNPDVFPMFYLRPEIKTARRENRRLHVEGSGLSMNDDSAPVRWVRYYWNDHRVPVVRPIGVPVSTDGMADRIVLDLTSVTFPPGQRADLRMEFDDELDIRPVRHTTADTALFAITKASILKFVKPAKASKDKKTPAVPASALLQIAGTDFDPTMQVVLDYHDGSQKTAWASRTSDGSLICTIHPPSAGGFAIVSIRDPKKTPTAVSVAIEIPSPPEPKAPDFEESERTIKQIPVKQKSAN